VAKGFGGSKPQVLKLSDVLQLHRDGQIGQAEAEYGKLIAAGAKEPLIYTNLGAIYSQSERWDLAIEQYQQALKLQPNYPEAHSNLGNTFKAMGRLDEAIAAYETALGYRPDFVEAHLNLGTVLEELGRLEEAIGSYREALRLQPDYHLAYNNLGNALKAKGDLAGAMAAYGRSVQIQPQFADGYFNIGNVLQEQERLEEAIAAYRKALSLQPSHHQAHSNLGILWHSLGRMAEAVESYQKAIEVKADYHEAHRNLGMLLLAAGNFRSGWVAYEHRLLSKEDPLLHRPQGVAAWDGDKSFGGELILLCEQGFGDSIQFCRYAKLLARDGLKVVLQAHPKVVPLLTTLSPEIPVYPHGYAYPAGERRWYPLMSLPKLLGTDLTSIPAETAYLSIEEARCALWRERLAGETRKIGIAWQGNPKAEKGTLRGRSFALKEFAALTEIPNIELVSLQKGLGSEQLETCGFRDRFVACQDEISASMDFLDTGAIALACDLVITSDTSVAHVTAALGVPTWVVLQQVPEWRWLLQGATSPWYSTVRLFRQSRRGDWATPFGEVRDELQTLLAAGRNGSEAVQLFEQASALQDAGDLAGAIPLYEAAIALQPLFPEALTNLGNICQNDGQLEKALVYYRQALAARPAHPQILCNIAITLQELGRMDESVKNYEQAIKLKPDYAKARTNLAMLLLLIQEFGRGWPEYEQRFNCPNMQPIDPPRELPKWDGNLSYRGELILVAEQGLGDSLQFARYAQELKKKGLKVSIQADAKIAPLLATMAENIPVHSAGQTYRVANCRWYPLMSVPQVLKTELATIPATTPYLFGNPERQAYWREKLAATNRFKVAIAWQGNPTAETGNIKGRSFGLVELAGIAAVPSLELVSLQKFHGSEQLDDCSFRERFVDCQAEISASVDFVDTAAIMLSCDLVITADTSIAHLAGALGVPTWVALKKIPEWRWMLNRFDSPWYPTMRLFRQKQRGVWAGAFADMERELQLLIASRHA
jgi:tetratricopeptide (TPR) repeat protein